MDDGFSMGVVHGRLHCSPRSTAGSKIASLRTLHAHEEGQQLADFGHRVSSIEYDTRVY